MQSSISYSALPICLVFALPHLIVHMAQSRVKQHDLSVMQATDLQCRNPNQRSLAARASSLRTAWWL